jgi:transcriptional regulator with XRE-family HTH domain
MNLTGIGSRIRSERLKQRLTLQQLSARTGLSGSFLSQVERNITQPSVTSLKRIAQQLGISVVRLFSEDHGSLLDSEELWGYGSPIRKSKGILYNREIRVVRGDKRKGVSLPGSQVHYEVLTPDLNRQLEVMYMRVKEGDSSGNEIMVDAPGEKFGTVLRGVLEFRVADQVFELHAGDSICHPADVPHSWRGLKGDPIEVIWVQTPPTF